MKKYFVSAALGALMASSAAFAQVTQEEIDEFMGMYFDQYSNATSAKYLDKRCRHLSQDNYNLLVNNLESAKAWLQTFTEQQLLDTIDVGARQLGLDATKAPCGPASRGIVESALEFSKNLAMIADDALANAPAPGAALPPGDAAGAPPGSAATLSQEEQEQAKQATDAMVQGYTSAMLGWHVEQKCRHLGESLDREYDGNKRMIQGYFAQLIVPEAFEALNRNIEVEANGPGVPACGRDTFDLVENSFRVSRQLLAYLQQLPW